MKTIWKYEIDIAARQKISMPMGANFLCLQLQNGRPCVWFEVDSEKMEVPITIIMLGTGHERIRHRDYLGTLQLADFVWHVYKE